MMLKLFVARAMQRATLALCFVFPFAVSGFAQGNALRFNGSGHSGLATGFSSFTAYTIEAWIKPSDIKDASVIFYSSNSGPNADYSHRIALLSDGKVQHYFYDAGVLGNRTINSTTVLQPSMWYHVAITAANGGTARLYVNGVEEGDPMPVNTLWAAGDRFYLSSFSGPSSSFDYFGGDMDEVRIWNTQRSEADIQQSMNKSLMGRESGLVAYYTMNQSSGELMNNQVSTDHQMTVSNGITWIASNAGIRPSKGNALSFDGTNEGISVGANSSLNNLATSQFTFEAWINIPSSSEARSILRKTGDYNFFVYAQKLYIEIWPNGTGNSAWRQYAGTQTFSHGQWVHVAVSYNADVADFYINGVKETISGYAPGTNGNSENLFIGYSSIYSNFFNGSMDEVRIWNTARTEQQIQDNMNGALTGTESGLVAYYDFNGTTGNKLMDLSLNGNHGTLNNFENADWVASGAGWSNSAYLDNIAHFRTMSSPVATSYADILAEVWLQGTGTTGGDYAGGTSNVWTWNNGAEGDGAENWTAVTNYNATVSAGQGFLYYHFNNDDGTGGSNTTDTKISVSGTENSNPSITVNTNTDGWTLVGNPFSQPVHWDVFAAKSNLYEDAQFYNGSTGAWVTTTAQPSIPPFRAFFVRSFFGFDLVLNIGTAAQRAGSGFRGKSSTNLMELALTVKSGTFEDEAMVRFSPDGKTGKDRMDAKKLNPLSARYLAIPVYGEDEVLAINSLPVPESEIQIPIGFDFTASGKVTFGLRKNTLPEGWSATLVDTKTGARIPVVSGFAYSFDHEFAGKVRSADEIVGSSLEMKAVAAPRFTLVVAPANATSNERGNLPVILALEQNYPNPFNPATDIRFDLPAAGAVKLEVLNTLGQTVATVANGTFAAGRHTVRFDASKLASGVYLYRLSSGGVVLTRKMSLVK